MADAVATISISKTSNDQAFEYVYGTVAIGASPLTYTAKGLVMSFASQDQIKATSAPLAVFVFSAAPAGAGAANLYVYNFNPGTTQANGYLQIFTGAAAQTALTELSNGSIPAGVSGDTITFFAIFNRV